MLQTYGPEIHVDAFNFLTLSIMKSALLWFGFITLFSAATAKSDFFPEERRIKTSPDVPEEDFKKLQEIARFLRKRVEEAEAAEEISDRESETQRKSSRYEPNPPFEYNLPKVYPGSDDFEPFAVSPFDPRYYQDFGRQIEGTNDDVAVDESKEKRPKTEIPKETALEETTSEEYGPSHSYIRQVPVTNVYEQEGKADIYFTAIVAGCTAAAVVTVIGIGIGCYRLQKNAKAAADVDYPAYGVTGPNKDVSPTSGDRRLAQSAQMYHYQHQKQQIIAMESVSNKERRSSVSDAESEEENEEGDYTVYECPGLASTGEMEVKNPLFQDDQTPASKPANEEESEESRELPNLISFD